MEAGKNVTGFLTLSNTTPKAMNATVQIEDDHGAILGTHAITIPPGGMSTLNLLELQSVAANQGGIRVSFVGAPDALLVNGGLEDAGVGYSASLPFTTPEPPLPPMAQAIKPQGIAELGLMTGKADPYMNFPAGTVFTPYSVLRNVSSSTISVTPTLWWMQGSAPDSFQLPSIRILPSQTYSLDMPSLLASAGLKNFSGSLNLVLDTQGHAGLLIAAGSVDQANTYVFEVQPHSTAMSAGKNLSYWSTGNGNDTMVTIWNPADEEQTFIFRLVFAGGHYDDLMTIGPRATAMFDISDLIRSAGADAEGNIIPPGTQEGSAKIVGIEADNENIMLAVDAGIYNVRKATCYQGCTTCDGASWFQIYLGTFGVGVDGQQQESLIGQWNTGAQYDYTTSGNTTWSSSNTSVATVQAGLVKGVSTGEITVVAYTGGIVPIYEVICNAFAPCPIYGGGGNSAAGKVGTTIYLDTSTCATNGSQVDLNGEWSDAVLNGSCTLGALVWVGNPSTDGGTCPAFSKTYWGNTEYCYSTIKNNCQKVICPPASRLVDSSCTTFLDNPGQTEISVPAGCTQ